MFKLTRERLYFVTLFILIALIMLALHLAPPSLQDKLVLNYQSFSFSNSADWIRLYTMHFVHKDFWHLLGNLITFAIIFPLIYFLAEIGDSFDSFKRLLIFVFIILPPSYCHLRLARHETLQPSLWYGFLGNRCRSHRGCALLLSELFKEKTRFQHLALNFLKLLHAHCGRGDCTYLQLFHSWNTLTHCWHFDASLLHLKSIQGI